MKLLQFHQDHRPPYWGTWSKSSKQVTGRRPLGRDTKGILNYDYDSEGGWSCRCRVVQRKRYIQLITPEEHLPGLRMKLVP